MTSVWINEVTTLSASYRLQALDLLEPKLIGYAIDTRVTMQLQVMIADDSAAVRTALRTLLSVDPALWRVCGEATDGQEAIVMARNLNPNVLLLDNSLPRISGIEVAKVLRSNPSLEIVLMSQQEPEVIRQMAESVPLRFYLAKSQIGGQLLNLLRTIHRSLSPSSLPQ